MEAAPVEANIGMPAATSQLTVRLVFRLKYDLSSFRSVLQLERSQLLQQILTPKSFPYLKTAHVSFEYRGNVRTPFIVFEFNLLGLYLPI